EFPRLIASHPGVAYFLDAPLPDWDRATIVKCPPGTIFIWDPVYGPRNASGNLAINVDEFTPHGWVHDLIAEELLNMPILPQSNRPAVDSQPMREPARWRVFRSVMPRQAYVPPAGG